MAVDEETDNIVGFVTVLSDGVLAAYIPLLEVVPAYRGRGIGTALLRRALLSVHDLYMTDLSCDPQMLSFYERFGMREGTAMCRRNYEAQSGSIR